MNEIGRNRTKLNPGINRGDDETIESYMGRLDEYLSKLEWQSEGHRMWYTHKNPYGCWICELLQVARSLRDNIDMDVGDNPELELPDIEDLNITES